MWRYLPGVTQPSKRKHNDDEEDEVRPQSTPSKRKFPKSGALERMAPRETGSTNLMNSFQALGHMRLVPTRIGGTRWVGHLLRALDHFLRGYQGLVLHLEQIQSSDAQNVRGVQQAKARKILYCEGAAMHGAPVHMFAEVCHHYSDPNS
ncbi:hypothetical protein WMY93_000571 [Mugilogobius chulae]|uniref:Uncharacterized protein n=1 Tax=Mugilogobius chulae TaxID=88201 RepID=A0AAW0Q0R9_9GOBI